MPSLTTCILLDSNRGVKQLTAAYRDLAAELKLDAIVLCDGGTDSVSARV
jgi:hypothetical protein